MFYYSDLLSREELAAFRSLSRIAYQLPAEPFYELCQGYEWDILGKVVETEDQLTEYCSYVASSVGVLCTFVMANERRDWFSGSLSKPLEREREVVEAARNMGLSLQLTNIARDIVTDSESLGRCYLPTDLLDEVQIEALTQRREPWAIGQKNLRNLSLRILDLADEMKAKSKSGIELLPSGMRRPVIAATNIYNVIGKVIRKNPGYPKRASATIATKVGVLLKAIYSPTAE